ncbi:semaphorin-4D isoform X6 [Acanthochromis polyacanthus]|uniref:semaphorin-4D isoform X6 n=1 Tax=Acanthochromis polyacanthus TaxID=80966 RepID=UPI002234575D|nr:semaphorin-4D isoform X6 [Acanthochromis polyacanthus]
MNQFSLADAMTDKGNFTVPKLSESNMGFGVLGVFLGLLLEVSTHGPHAVPRTSWRHQDLDLMEFSEPGVFNYSTLLLSEERDALYVGAREAIFQLSKKNVTVKNNKVLWTVADKPMSMCTTKGKSKERDCLNYIRVLQVVDDERLYVCGTHAFQPQCDYLNLGSFSLDGRHEDGRGKCSFDPSQSFTTVMVDGELYSGTAYNFLGSEPIISRYSPSQSLLRTEYSTSWLNEPSFVFADVIREGKNRADGEDDKIYYFFTEVSVEYEFFGKLLIPRVARVCKGDLGGQRTLQKKWTSFLKAKLVCSMPELNFVFNVVHDVFILKGTDWRDTVIYGVFTSQWGNVGLSAVCAYNMTAVEEVFSKGKYMQKATVEQSHTKWVRYNGVTPSPRPGACINNLMRQQNISSSLHLPDKTLQFVKDHPLLEDPVLPIGNGPRLITKDVNYTQIVVERVRALDKNIYDVIFTGTDKGVLHKSVVFEGEVHIVEEIQLLKNSEPIKNLLLSSETRSLYAGSDSGVVQSPTAFCGRYSSCDDCVLARDPYCAWDPHTAACVNIFDIPSQKLRRLIQSLNGDADVCPSASSVDTSSSLLSSGSSTPPVLPSSSSSSSWSSSSTKPHNVEAREAEVRLLPPLLKDQAWGVHAQEAFLLFCLALGPSDVHIHWLINGHSLDTPIMEYRRPLGQRTVLVSSWLREGPLIKDARYHCVAEASTGNDMSEIDLRLTIGDEENIPSRDLNQWRGALTEHEQLLKRWEKAWESCDGHRAL